MTQFDAAEDPIPRDRFGRPLIVPPDGSSAKPVPYTRCTTFVGVMDDTWNITQWEKRMVAIGLVERKDLLLSVAAHRDPTEKKTLNKIVDQAKEAARASSAATVGTAVHKFTELVDRGDPIPDYLPDDAKRDLRAYQQGTRSLRPVAAEQFTVNDHFQVGGTPDRVVEHGGRYFIADLKTGNVEFAAMKIAMQMAMYAHSVPYSHTTGERTPWQWPIDQDWGLVIHLPAGEAHCELKWIDIAAGWEAVQTAYEVRQWRARKAKDWYRPFGEPASAEELTPGELDPVSGYLKRVTDTGSVLHLYAIWSAAAATRHNTDELRAACKARRLQIEGKN